MKNIKIQPGQQFPDIEVAKLGGGKTNLLTTRPGTDWKIVVVYRGKHCPLCTTYLKKLDELYDQFVELGVDVVAVSGDPKERAEAQISKVNPKFDIGYAMTVEQMRELGLYISDPRSPQETDRQFPEPGFFIINDQGQIQIVDISNAPFSRPDLDAILSGLKFVRNPDNNYPIRGMAT